MHLPKSAHKPIENENFVKHFSSWFTITNEIHEHLYPMNNNNSYEQVNLARIQYAKYCPENFMYVS